MAIVHSLFVQAVGVTQFAKVAPYLQDPLVLIGFFLFLAFLFTRTLLKRGIIPTLPPTAGFKILKTLLLYGFLIGLVLIFLGFGFKYMELRAKERQATAEINSREKQAQIDRDIKAAHEKEQQDQELAMQRNTVALLKVELQGNLALADELRKNTIVFLNGFKSTSQVVRTPGIKLLVALFPAENIDLKLPDNEAARLSNKVFDGLEQSQLHKDQLELQKFTAAANAISTSIDLQMSTIQKLQDADHKRYVFQSQIWQANLPILRNVIVGNVSRFEESYADLNRLRTNYDLVTQHYVEYLNALRQFFDPQKHTVNRDSLHLVLAKERNALQLITAFSEMLVRDTRALKSLETSFAPGIAALNSPAAPLSSQHYAAQQSKLEPPLLAL
jgi:hypothetical protein